MFSTIKSRVIAISAIVLFISVISSILIGALLAKVYMNNQLYGNMQVLYMVDTGEELDSIANTDYFNEARLLNKSHDQQQLLSSANQAIINSIIIVALVLIIAFAYLFNLGYDKFIKGTLSLENDKVSDFSNIKHLVETQSDKLTNSYRDVDKINSYVNHELKNSLAVLKTKQLNSSEFESYIDALNNQIDDISALTTNKLTNCITIDSLLLVANVIDNYSVEKIDFNFADGNYNLNGNRTLLTRAVDNIISNAFKYGANHVDISMYNLGLNIIIKISNDGDQIIGSEIDKIFDFKYRTPELKPSGSGVGLALVRNIVELHGGGIYVESNSNETSFYLSFKYC